MNDHNPPNALAVRDDALPVAPTGPTTELTPRHFEPGVLRVFFAHSIAITDTDLALYIPALVALVNPPWAPFTVAAVTAARHQWTSTAAREGGFKGGWPRHIATGKHPTLDVPLFHTFVVPGMYCGRGTADIVEAAMRSARPVWMWIDATTLTPVRMCSRENTGDQKLGWRLFG